MEISENLQLAWQKDSFYVKTTCEHGAHVFMNGAVGFMSGRISGVISPRNGAIWMVTNSVSGKIANIFTNWIKSDDKKLEDNLKRGAGLGFSCIIHKGISSLSRQKGIPLLKDYFKFLAASLVIVIPVNFAINYFLPSPQPEPEPEPEPAA